MTQETPVIKIDFTNIGSEEEFYEVLNSKINLPEHFGKNLDALFDTLTGDAGLPMEIDFVNMSVEQLEDFEDLISTMEDAEDEAEGLTFRYFLEQFEEDQE